MRTVGRMACFFVAGVFFLQGAAKAQVTGARLEGLVTDETKAVTPGAAVTITNVETGISRNASTNEQGRYVFADLPPARYDLSASLPGFKTTRRQGITLTVGSTVAVNLTLSVGEVTEQVTVTGEAPLVETRSGAVAGVVEEKAIRELPLNGRSFTNLMQLEPGVMISRAGSKAELSGLGDKMSLGGARPHQMSFLLDGADMMGKDNTNPAGASGVMLGVDTIQEFRVSTSAFSAEFGRNLGGVVSAVTKSGTNDFHGTVYAFHRNDNLDARNFFDIPRKPEFKRNQLGFTFGGPVARNRTFFFGSYEGLRERLGITRADSVPNAEARQGRLPNRTVQVGANMRPYLDIYPLPNGPDLGGGVGRYFWAGSNNTNQNDFLVRLDHQLSNNDSLTGRVFFDDGQKTTPTSLGLLKTLNDSRIQSYVVNHKRIFGSSVVNDFRVAFNRFNLILDDGIPEEMNRLEFIPGRGYGRLEPRGFSTISTGSTNPRFWTQNMYEYIDDVAWARGSHTLKFGGIAKRIQFNGFSAARFRGEYQFQGLAEFLTGQAQQFEVANVFAGTRGMRQWMFGMYFQDDLRPTSRLTLNWGLRYEFVTAPNEVTGRISNLRQQLDSGVIVGNPFFQNPSLKNFAPRVGFAYDLTGDGKTSVRGGFGVYMDQLLPIYYRDNVFRVLPFQQRFFVTPQDLPNIPFPNAGGLFLNQPPALRDPNVQLDLANWDPHQPYAMQFNLTAQRQVLPDLSVMVGYMGSQTRNNSRNVNWNSSFPTAIIDGQKCWSVAGSPPSQCFTGRASPRRNPNFAAVLQRQMDSNANYNSLQVQVKKRYSRRLDFNVVYQWARTMDEISGISGSTDFSNITSFSMDPEDRSRDYGRAAFDIRHYLTMNGTYEIPDGGLAGVARQVLGGWKLSSLFNYSSGEPFTVINGFDRAGNNTRIFGFQERPDLAPGRSNNPTLGSPDRWYDPTAFQLQPPGFLGNLGRNTLQGPNVFAMDLAVLKNFSLTEAKRLEFRWELFNLFNRANFGDPDFAVFLSATSINPSAGRITTTRTSSRQMQFALKFIF